jgi:hypothetical protein
VVLVLLLAVDVGDGDVEVGVDDGAVEDGVLDGVDETGVLDGDEELPDVGVDVEDGGIDEEAEESVLEAGNDVEPVPEVAGALDVSEFCGLAFPTSPLVLSPLLLSCLRWMCASTKLACAMANSRARMANRRSWGRENMVMR